MQANQALSALAGCFQLCPGTKREKIDDRNRIALAHGSSKELLSLAEAVVVLGARGNKQVGSLLVRSTP